MSNANANLLRTFLLALLFVVCALPAYAATLSFTNPGGTVGQTLSVSVLVSAQNEESLNGVSTRVEFPTDKFTLLSLSKAGSVITFWAEEPSFSNSAGTASLEGIIPNPGYSGQGGRVITLVFQVKAPGTATLSFSGASVLANDGRGTNILTSAAPRTLSLSTSAQVPPAPQKAAAPPSGEKTKPIPTETATSTEEFSSSTPDSDIIASGTKGIFYDPPPYLVIQVGRVLVLLLAGVGLIALLLAGYLALSRALINRRKALNAPNIVHRSFGLLKEDIATHLAHLKDEPSTPLTEDEIAFLDQFEKDLGEVEGIVEKKLKKGEA